MKIPRKLSLSFVLICVSAAVMMAVFFATIMMIRASTESNNLSRAIEAQAMSLETSILRQNSQFRGFLVTGDETYLKSYYEGRDDYDHVVVDLRAMLSEPENQRLLEQSRTATLARCLDDDSHPRPGRCVTVSWPSLDAGGGVLFPLPRAEG